MRRTMPLAAMVFAGATVVGTAQAQTSDAAEIDTYALTLAEAACRDQDFATLLEAMSISDLARQKYSAETVTVVRGGTVTKLPRAEYHDFPLGMLDYTWVTQASMKGWTPEVTSPPEALDVVMNQSQSNQWRVDWQQVVYDGLGEGDDPGKVVERIGAPGVLQFEPFEGCWQLIEDQR